MDEEWLPLAGAGVYGACYEVSNTGLIRSLERRVRVKGVNKFRTVRGQIIKPRVNRGGYLQVTLSYNRKPKTLLVHRLVCRTFNGPQPPGKNLVLHGDGDRTNNRSSNLRWGDALDNAADTRKHGTVSRYHALKTHCPQNHEYTEANTYIIPSTGSRSCVTCKKASSHRAWIKLRESKNNDRS